MKGALIIAHGSRAVETEKILDKVVEMVKKGLPDHIIETSFMEFSERTIEKGIGNLVEKGVTEIKAVPYFLFDGIHIQEDIPNEIEKIMKKHKGVTITLTGTLGPDPCLADILTQRIKG